MCRAWHTGESQSVPPLSTLTFHTSQDSRDTHGGDVTGEFSPLLCPGVRGSLPALKKGKLPALQWSADTDGSAVSLGLPFL